MTAHMLTHEWLHHLTSQEMSRPGSKLATRIQELYRWALQEAQRLGVDPQEHYGLSAGTPGDFLAEAISSEVFQKVLATMKSDGRTSASTILQDLRDSIKRWIQETLGWGRPEQQSVLDDALAEILGYLDEAQGPEALWDFQPIENTEPEVPGTFRGPASYLDALNRAAYTMQPESRAAQQATVARWTPVARALEALAPALRLERIQQHGLELPGLIFRGFMARWRREQPGPAALEPTSPGVTWDLGMLPGLGGTLNPTLARRPGEAQDLPTASVTEAPEQAAQRLGLQYIGKTELHGIAPDILYFNDPDTRTTLAVERLEDLEDRRDLSRAAFKAHPPGRFNQLVDQGLDRASARVASLLTGRPHHDTKILDGLEIPGPEHAALQERADGTRAPDVTEPPGRPARSPEAQAVQLRALDNLVGSTNPIDGADQDPYVQWTASVTDARDYLESLVNPIFMRSAPSVHRVLMNDRAWLASVRGWVTANVGYSDAYWGLDDQEGRVKRLADVTVPRIDQDLKIVGHETRQAPQRTWGSLAVATRLNPRSRAYIRLVHEAAKMALEPFRVPVIKTAEAAYALAHVFLNPAFDPGAANAEDFVPGAILAKIRANPGRFTARSSETGRQIYWVPASMVRDWWMGLGDFQGPGAPEYQALVATGRKSRAQGDRLDQRLASLDPHDLTVATQEMYVRLGRELQGRANDRLAVPDHPYLWLIPGYTPHWYDLGFIGARGKDAVLGVRRMVRETQRSQDEAKLVDQHLNIVWSAAEKAQRGRALEVSDRMLKVLWGLAGLPDPSSWGAARTVLREGPDQLLEQLGVPRNPTFLEVSVAIHQGLMQKLVERSLRDQKVDELVVGIDPVGAMAALDFVMKRYRDREVSGRALRRAFPTFERAYDVAGLLPQEGTPMSQVNRYMNDLFTVTVNKMVLSQMVLQLDADGRPLVILNPALDHTGDSFLSPEVWREHALRVSHYFGKPLDPNMTAQENLAQIIGQLKLSRESGGDYTVVDSRYSSINSFLAYRRPGGDENVLDLSVGGEVAGLLKHIVGTEATKEWLGVDWLKVVGHVNQWMKSLSLGFSAFFAIAGLESIQTMTSGSLWDYRNWGARDRLSLRQLRNMVKSNDPYLADVLAIMRDVGIELSDSVKLIDAPMGMFEDDVERVSEWVARTQGPAAATAVRRVLHLSTSQTDIIFGTLFNTFKIYTTLKLAEELRVQYEHAGKPFDLREALRPWAGLINDNVGGQNVNRYSWLTPGWRQALNLSLFSWNWSLSAWNQAGGGLLTGALFKNYMTPEQVSMTFGRIWPATFFHVLFAVPFLMQLGIWTLFSAPDDDEAKTKFDKPFVWQNEDNRGGFGQWYIDITPLARKTPWYRGDPTGNRRFYLRFGKQFQEVFRWFSDPINNYLGKQSQFARMAFEQATGKSPGSEWNLAFKNEGLAGLITSEREGFAGSRIGMVAQKFTPFSVLAWAKVPEAFPVQFIGPVSKGKSMTVAVQEAEAVLRTWAYRYDEISKRPHIRKNIEALLPEILGAAQANGYDPKKVLESARGQVLRDLYRAFYVALNNSDETEMDQVGRRIVRLNGAVENLKRSIKNRNSMYGKPQDLSSEQVAMIEQAFQAP